MSEFTVKVEPRKIVVADTAQNTDDPVYHTARTVYDIHVIDGQGGGGEEFLIGSRQGYENRQDAINLAVRLFGSAWVIAQHLGIDPPELRDVEKATLVVHGHDGQLVYRRPLR